MENSIMHERIIGLYEANAEAWDSARGADARLEERWLERFADLLPAGGRILDIGCGTGQPVARWLGGRGFRVTGVDSSPSLIAICRRRFPEGDWRVTDMRRLDLEERFDGLVAWHSLFHLAPEDQRPMFERFAAHASPGAALMFTSGWEEGVRIGEWQGEPLYHASLGTSEYRRLLGENGFDVLAHEARDAESGEATVWIARHIRPSPAFYGRGARAGTGAGAPSRIASRLTAPGSPKGAGRRRGAGGGLAGSRRPAPG